MRTASAARLLPTFRWWADVESVSSGEMVAFNVFGESLMFRSLAGRKWGGTRLTTELTVKLDIFVHDRRERVPGSKGDRTGKLHISNN